MWPKPKHRIRSLVQQIPHQKARCCTIATHLFTEPSFPHRSPDPRPRYISFSLSLFTICFCLPIALITQTTPAASLLFPLFQRLLSSARSHTMAASTNHSVNLNEVHEEVLKIMGSDYRFNYDKGIVFSVGEL